MSKSFRVPDFPGAAVRRIDVRNGLRRGRCSGCCVCDQTCWTWWSPNPPSEYVPLHRRCIDGLFEHWKTWQENPDEMPAPAAPAVVLPRIGAYARLASTVAARPEGPTATAVALTGRRAAVLPGAFTPGPFWLPGDTADSPWTVVTETASGRTVYPFDTHDRAFTMATRLEKLRETSDRVPMVAATLVSPDGFCETVWGKPIDLDESSRWQAVVRLHYWAYCRGCSGMRWPGTWIEMRGMRCLACLAESEQDDPRPALNEPAYPGDRYVPKEFTKAPKPLALPKGFGRRR